MKTTTWQEVLNGAAEYAERTRDNIPAQEQIMLQRYLAANFRRLLHKRAWADLTDFWNVTAVANQQFSRNEGSADPNNPELGDIIGIYTMDPRVTGCHARYALRLVDWAEADDVIYVETNRTNLWVEYMLPYPGLVFPNYTPGSMTLAQFLAATIPLEFEDVLSHVAAARLLAADGNAQGAALEISLSNDALADEINAQPPEPWWRNTVRLSAPGGARTGFYY